MILVIVIASATTLVLALAALMTRRAWARRRSTGPGRHIEEQSSPIATLRSRAADSRDVYAPAFIVEPGQCFRLSRDPATGAAWPCDRQVEGKGEFLDRRGNVVEVEACRAHMVDLVNWQFRAVDG